MKKNEAKLQFFCRPFDNVHCNLSGMRTKSTLGGQLPLIQAWVHWALGFYSFVSGSCFLMDNSDSLSFLSFSLGSKFCSSQFFYFLPIGLDCFLLSFVWSTVCVLGTLSGGGFTGVAHREGAILLCLDSELSHLSFKITM